MISSQDHCPIAESLYQYGFYIPSGMALTDIQIYEVAEKVRKVINKHS
jgi:perosamine synthetase